MTDQAPELREKMHNAVCKILTGNEICTDAGDWLCPQDVDGVNEMCADIVVAVLALTRPPSERPETLVQEILQADAEPPEASFDNAEDMLKWLNAPSERPVAQVREALEQIEALSRAPEMTAGLQWGRAYTIAKNALAALTAERPEAGMIQANSSASEKVCDHPISEDHRQAASMFLCWPTNAIDLAQNDSDLPELVEKLAQFIANRERIALRAAPPDGQVIAHPANSLRSLPESSEPSLLGRETVREETIEECARIARSVALQMLAGMKLPADVRASDSQLSFGHKIADCIEADIRALASLTPLKE